MSYSLSILADAGNQPILPADVGWVRAMLIIILVLFLSAMIVGPIVRARSPREMPMRHTAEPGVREDVPH